MYHIMFRGELIAAFSHPYIAASVAILRFTSGQLFRGEVEVIRVG
jgi:hypothetical protein